MQLRRLPVLLAFLALMPVLASCADVPKSPEAKNAAANNDMAGVDDPLEPMNRSIFDVNDFLDRLLIRPLTELYRFAIPDYARDRVANAVSNFDEPVIFLNDMLQGRVSDAGTTAERLAINSTLGVGGLWDVADDWGMHKQMGDFGQTLSVWGINGGPYLVLPLFGPSNFRDAIGLGVDMVSSPWQYLARLGGQGTENRVVFSEWAADGLTRRDQNIEGLDALRAGSLDFYAEMRSVYTQYRNKQLGIEVKQPSFDYYE